MRHFDLAPLHRATVGFDQVAELMDRLLTSDVSQPSYPPYNIEKLADDAWRVSIAVAGFSEQDLTVEVRENALIVTGRKAQDDTQRTYLHRGIATRAFERRFDLADDIQVGEARLEHGMLHVALERVIPEEKKPRQITIRTSDQVSSKRGQVIEQKAA